MKNKYDFNSIELKILENDKSFTTLLLDVDRCFEEFNKENTQKTLFSALESNQFITKFGLKGNEFNNNTKLLGKMLKTNTSITMLFLQESEYEINHYMELMNGLKNHTNLLTLSLSCNHLYSAQVDILIDTLRELHHLKKLDLSYNSSMGVGGLTSLFNFLHTSAIQTINLANNLGEEHDMTPSCLNALQNSVRKNQSLVSLNLDSVNLKDLGTLVLSSALKENKVLNFLSLNNNQVTCQGAIALAEFLDNNDTLQKLNLANNQISAPGIKALAFSLKRNKSLLSLNLNGNSIKTNSKQDFQEGLQFNFKLLSLTGPLNKTINNYLKRNRKIFRCMSMVKRFYEDKNIDENTLESALNQLELTLKSLDYNPETIYPFEVFRLLTGIGHLLNSNIKEAYNCLIRTFESHHLQNIACKALGQLISGAFKPEFYNSTDPLIMKARSKAILYYFRNELSAPEFRNFAYISIFTLQHERMPNINELAKLKEKHILLCKAEIQTLVNLAIEELPSENTAELNALTNLSDFSNIMNYKALWKTLKTKYPKAKSFFSPEYFLLQHSNLFLESELPSEVLEVEKSKFTAIITDWIEKNESKNSDLTMDFKNVTKVGFFTKSTEESNLLKRKRDPSASDDERTQKKLHQ